MSDKYPGGFVTAGAPAGFSVAFDGSGDVLVTPASANLAMGTGAFTVECWFYTNGNGSDGLISGIDSASGNYSAAMYFSGSTTMKISIQSGVAAAFDSGNITFTPYTWNHAVLVRDGSGNVAAFLNGVRQATGTTSQNITQNLFNIGRTYVNTGSGTFSGYISNVRIVKGTAVYDPTATTINVPTQLFPITNTQLLICQSPTIIDNSSNAFAITVSGNAAPSNFTPFAAYQGFNPALGAAAGGVWTLDEAAYYQNNRQWPIYDPYFNNTTLMLHGNGTNAAQNNTFLDSSTNNFTITRNGNTTQGSFSPFSQTGWSTRFDGSSDGFTIPSSSLNGAWVNSNFTYEAWLYVDNTNSNNFFWLYGQNNNDALYLGLTISGSGTSRNINYGSFNGISFNYSYSTPNNVWNMNEWFHVAFVRDSTASNTGGMKIFVNGVMVGQGNTGTFGVMNNSILWNNQIGGWANFPGYCGGLRLTNRALYSSNFTPERLTNVSGTLMLLCTDKTITDDGPNRYALTINGAPKVQAFSPFVPAYITPTTYSNWFDGSGDYLTASGAGLALGAGNFTVEGWFYTTGYNTGEAIYSGLNTYPASTGLLFYINGSGTYTVDVNGSNVIASGTAPLNTWTHVALVRSSTGSNGLALYINGVSIATGTTANDFTSTYAVIGRTGFGTASNYWLGCLSNIRILVGTALYTTNFTPPTAPLTAITNTSLLTCQSSTFIDNSTNNFTITANGNVQPVTSPTPFPANVDTTTLNSAYSTSLIGGSAYFDGTTASTVTTNQIVTVGTQDFCLEAWVYCVSTTSYACIVGNDTAGPGTGMFIEMGTARGIWLGGPEVSLGGVQYNRWVHLVFSRVSGTYAGYVNGVRQATGTFSTNLSNSIKIGVNNYVTGTTTGAGITGYISGVRVIVGSSPYLPTSTAFAPPIAPPTPVTNTLLLLNYTNAGIIDNTAKNVLETVGNAQISTAQSKWGGSSMLFDGTGDFLIAPDSPNYSFGTGDFTVEGWLYLNAINRTNGVWTNGPASTGSVGIYVTSANKIEAAIYGGTNATSATSLAANTWYHFAATRSGSTLRIFLNGIQEASVTNSTNNTTSKCTVGNSFTNLSESPSGYIDDLRITKGVARYVANFTPPTSQLQDQ